MIDWLKAIQLKARYLFGVFVFGASILLLPEDLAKQFGITDIRNTYKGYIGIATIGAFSFWVIQIGQYFLSKRREKERRKIVLTQVNSLSQNEMLIVVYCLFRNQNTISLPITNAAANALCQKGLMVSAGHGSILKMPFTFHPFVWSHLQSIKHQILPPDAHTNQGLIRTMENLEHSMKWNDIDLMH